MNIVGLSAWGDASGACLVRDGRVLAAAEEARFTRRLDEVGLPRRAVRFCLAQGGLSSRDVDAWVFHEKPLRRFERVLAQQLARFPRSSRSFARELFAWLGDRLWLKAQIADAFGLDPARILFSEHHLSHAADAFFQSPFDEAAVLVVDGAGEWATTSLARAQGNQIEILAEIHHPHSLALASRAVAAWLGFTGPAGIDALAALAAHGEPRFAAQMRAFVSSGADGHFELAPTAFESDLGDGLRCAKAWIQSFGSARLPTDPLEIAAPGARHADLAASFQVVVEEALLALVHELHRRVPMPALCLSGVLAHNAAAVARVAREGPFSQLFVPPACTDAGAAVGAALHAHSALVPETRPAPAQDPFMGEAVVRDERDSTSVPAARSEPDDERRLAFMLEELCAGRTLAWMRGRAEFGPQALGHRVILADPRRADAAERLSLRVTRREVFWPYAPALPAECADLYFEVPPGARGLACRRQVSLQGTPKTRGVAPAALDHAGRAVAHLVERAADPLFHRLLTRFGERTGAPLVLSSSFAPRGEPPVRTEREALSFFERSALDVLVIEERIYTRD